MHFIGPHYRTLVNIRQHCTLPSDALDWVASHPGCSGERDVAKTSGSLPMLALLRWRSIWHKNV